VTLDINETATVNFTVKTRENLSPGDFRITVGAGNSISIHGAANTTYLSVLCPEPRPVLNIQSKTIIPFYSFGLQAGPVYLSWDGCTHPMWCCCPCQYSIERNGEYIGTSDTVNYTDSTKLSIGTKYTYNITTIDRFGKRSTSIACDTTLVVEINPPDLTGLAEFMTVGMVCIGALGLILYILVWCLRRYEAKKRGVLVKPLPRVFSLFWLLITRPCPKKPKKPLLELTSLGKTKSEESGPLLEAIDMDDE